MSEASTEGCWAPELNPKGLSQGDILCSIPLGAPAAPLVFLGRDTFNHPTRGVYYPQRAELERFPGDPGGLFIAKGRITYGLVMTHSCDLDDPRDGARILVAPVANIENVSDQSSRERIMRRGRLAFVPLPAVPGVGDCYADLRSMAPLDRPHFGDAKRACSMTEESVLLLHAQLIKYFSRVELSAAQDGLAAAE